MIQCCLLPPPCAGKPTDVCVRFPLTPCLLVVLTKFYCMHAGYPVAGFNGHKGVVLSTTSWLGGRNSFLGIAYLVVGAWCVIFGIFFIAKNYRSPR